MDDRICVHVPPSMTQTQNPMMRMGFLHRPVFFIASTPQAMHCNTRWEKSSVSRQAGTTCPLLASRLYPKQRYASHTVHTLYVASLSLYTFPTVVGEVREATQWKISLLCHADILLFLPPSPSPAYHIVTGTIRNVHISSRTEGKWPSLCHHRCCNCLYELCNVHCNLGWKPSLDGWDWLGSPGGVRFRTTYGANKRKDFWQVFNIVGFLKCLGHLSDLSFCASSS